MNIFSIFGELGGDLDVALTESLRGWLSVLARHPQSSEDVLQEEEGLSFEEEVQEVEEEVEEDDEAPGMKDLSALSD